MALRIWSDSLMAERLSIKLKLNRDDGLLFNPGLVVAATRLDDGPAEGGPNLWSFSS